MKNTSDTAEALVQRAERESFDRAPRSWGLSGGTRGVALNVMMDPDRIGETHRSIGNGWACVDCEQTANSHWDELSPVEAYQFPTCLEARR